MARNAARWLAPVMTGHKGIEAEDVEAARARAAKIAAEVVAGVMSPILAARELACLRFQVGVPATDPDFLCFVGIDSETDALPLGLVRREWAPEVLSQKDGEIEPAEKWAMEVGRDAFKSVAARWARLDQIIWATSRTPADDSGRSGMTLTSSESQLFSDLDLSRRLERAEGQSNRSFVEARARAFPGSGACWIELAGVYAMYDGVSSPVTQTFGLGLFQTITSAGLEPIERFFLDRGAPVFHEVSPLADLSVLALLNERGYRPIELTSVMVRPVRQSLEPRLPRNERLSVRPVREDEGVLWAQTTAKGWSEHPELTEFLLDLGPICTRREGSISFFAELDGLPIATGVLCLAGGVALFGGASTIPDARRQGAQLALLDTRLRYAEEAGCDVAMMCALPGSASQRNAERHGFRVAYTRIKWQRGKSGG